MMKLKKRIRVMVAACAMLTLLAGQPAAQAPTVTWQQSGNNVRVEWLPIVGATSYEVFVTGTLTAGPLQVPTNFFVVAPPPGTYIVAVRGRAGNATGPLSNPVTIAVGQPSAGCAPVAAPAVSVSTVGSNVQVSWGAVAGTVGYRVQVGQTPGATQTSIDLPASQTSYSATVPLFGTFYVRVLSGSSCGAVAPSAEQTFTIGSPTPGPTAPLPTFVPNYEGLVNACRARYPAQFACAHTGQSCTRQFIVLCARDMNRIDPNVGLNWKRGAVGSLSEDIIAYRHVGTAVDIVNGGRMEIVDVIFGAGGANPSVGWNPGPGGPGDRGAWVNPFTIQP